MGKYDKNSYNFFINVLILRSYDVFTTERRYAEIHAKRWQDNGSRHGQISHRQQKARQYLGGTRPK